MPTNTEHATTILLLRAYTNSIQACIPIKHIVQPFARSQGEANSFRLLPPSGWKLHFSSAGIDWRTFGKSPMHFLCILVSAQFILTFCTKQYEIVACIIYVLGNLYPATGHSIYPFNLCQFFSAEKIILLHIFEWISFLPN